LFGAYYGFLTTLPWRQEGGGKHYTHKAPIPLAIGFYYLKLLSTGSYK